MLALICMALGCVEPETVRRWRQKAWKYILGRIAPPRGLLFHPRWVVIPPNSRLASLTPEVENSTLEQTLGIEMPTSDRLVQRGQSWG